MEKNKKRANSFNTGIASEHLVLSNLYRLGLEAYMSQGNKKGIDIRVVREDESVISIDVKSVGGYSSLVVNNVVANYNHFIVFVIYKNKFEDVISIPDIYIVPSTIVVEIAKSFKDEKRIMKGDLEEYKNKWQYIIKGFGEDGWEIDEKEEEHLNFVDCHRELQQYENVTKILKKYNFTFEYFIKLCRRNPQRFSIDEERLIFKIYESVSIEQLIRLRNNFLRESKDNPIIETLNVAIKTREDGTF